MNQPLMMIILSCFNFGKHYDNKTQETIPFFLEQSELEQAVISHNIAKVNELIAKSNDIDKELALRALVSRKHNPCRVTEKHPAYTTQQARDAAMLEIAQVLIKNNAKVTVSTLDSARIRGSADLVNLLQNYAEKQILP
jgi:hypothetical protein